MTQLVNDSMGPVGLIVCALIGAYLLGSIPSAYLAGKLNGIDLREHGSGNLGATNVVRVLGARIGAAVFAVDILKGFLPVYLAVRYWSSPMTLALAMAVGTAAIVGHIKPVFLLTKGGGGGKGVATAAGVFLGLAPVPMLVALVSWVLVFSIWRYVSLASLVAAAILPVAMFAVSRNPTNPVFVMSVIITAFVFFTHRSNMQRLMSGQEHQFKKDKEAKR